MIRYRHQLTTSLWVVLLVVLGRPLELRGDAPAEFASLTQRFSRQYNQAQYQAAQETVQQMQAMAKGPLRRSPAAMAQVWLLQARLDKRFGRHTQAAEDYQQAQELLEKSVGPNSPLVAHSLFGRAEVYRTLGHYEQSIPLYTRAIQIWQAEYGAVHTNVAAATYGVAAAAQALGRFDVAESYAISSYQIDEKLHGRNHYDVAACLGLLGTLCLNQGRVADAAEWYRQALEIEQHVLAPSHPHLANTLDNLAQAYLKQGRYGDAVLLAKRGLRIREQRFGPNHPDVARSLVTLSRLDNLQGRAAEAVAHVQRALNIEENTLGPEHPTVAVTLNTLANLHDSQGELGLQEPLLKRALAIRETQLGTEHLKTAVTLGSLANLYNSLGRDEEAEALYKRACAIRRQGSDMVHPELAVTLHKLSDFYLKRGRYNEARQTIERALEIQEAAGSRPARVAGGYYLRACILWSLGQRDAAVADLLRAMDQAERQRAFGSGGGLEHAQLFAEFTDFYEMMVRWQTELGQVDQAFAAMERSRARSLLNYMTIAGADLLAGLQPKEAERLRQQQRDTLRRLAGIETQLRRLSGSTEMAASTRAQRRIELQDQWQVARRRVVEAYADICGAVLPVGWPRPQNRRPIRLDQLSQWVSQLDALFLEYLTGEQGSYLLAIPSGAEARLFRLSLTVEQAQSLDATPGPLTTAGLADVLEDVLPFLDPPPASEDDLPPVKGLTRLDDTIGPTNSDRLAILWQVLLPESVRKWLQENKYQRLIIVPDGPLASFPFEMLVVTPEEPIQYLLDVCPPVSYGPSATVLFNLAHRPRRKDSSQESVLTVADPDYRADTRPRIDDTRTERTPSERYGSLAGPLERLPNTADESQEIVTVLREHQISVRQLLRSEATEANVRSLVSDRQILHFACHGLADSSFGNFFGALALTPGQDVEPASSDDGFLTLAELHGLNLRGCELSILSACQTNMGPQQQGEGAWSLSRGFLTAGSRRVVASNWLVDDLAAVALIGHFVRGMVRHDAPSERLAEQRGACSRPNVGFGIRKSGRIRTSGLRGSCWGQTNDRAAPTTSIAAHGFQSRAVNIAR